MWLYFVVLVLVYCLLLGLKFCLKAFKGAVSRDSQCLACCGGKVGALLLVYVQEG